MYPTVPGYPVGTATGYPTTSKPYSGFSYPSTAAAFTPGRPGYTPNYPGKGYPLGAGRRPLPFAYNRPRYGLAPLYGGLGLVTGLQLYYWLGLGHYMASPQFQDVTFDSPEEFITQVLDPMSNADLATVMGNGTQSCQKVILWRYEVAALIDAPQIRLYFDCLDKDGDGVIDPWEFCMEYGCYGEPGNRFADMDAAMQTIDVIDGDTDGVITPAEFDPKLRDVNSSVISQSG